MSVVDGEREMVAVKKCVLLPSYFSLYGYSNDGEGSCSDNDDKDDDNNDNVKSVKNPLIRLYIKVNTQKIVNPKI